MRKTTKKMLISVIGASLLACSVPYAVYAAEQEPVPTVYNVNVRIEGISGLIYSDSIEIWGAEEYSVADMLTYIDSQEESVTISGLENSYITDINGDYTGTFGGWDGWLYTVNGVEMSVGIGDCLISDGDSILIYYGDPYGVGMQYPSASYDNDRGVLTFTSLDTEYDADWNPIVTENPVVGMNVYWDETAYLTDENGQVEISAEQLTIGSHSVSYDKPGESGIPLVLRSEPGLTFEVKQILGDVSGDRSVTASDAAQILSHYAVSQTKGEAALTQEQCEAADMNSDGSITASDAATVLSYYAYIQTTDSFITVSEYINEVFGA